MIPRPPLIALLLVFVLAASCGKFDSGPKAPPPPPPPPSTPAEPLPPEPLAGPARVAGEPEPLPVKKVPDPIVVAAWAEPKRLPPWGGQVQILVRVQKRGGARYPGVEVRLATTTGSLYSQGDVLVTDSQGMTRDRLTAREAAVIILNAGGTRYRFQIPLDQPAP